MVFSIPCTDSLSKIFQFLDTQKENAGKRHNNRQSFLTELPKECGLLLKESQVETGCRSGSICVTSSTASGEHFLGKAHSRPAGCSLDNIYYKATRFEETMGQKSFTTFYCHVNLSLGNQEISFKILVKKGKP